MARYVYREVNGNIQPRLVSARVPHKGTPREATLGFNEGILDSYRQVEEKGGPWMSSYSKSLTKQVHERAAAEDRAHQHK